MAKKKRILYVSQEIKPYTKSSTLSETARYLPQAMNESGFEVRLFMPRFGSINERRHQLHEVIRLSGINLIVNDLDQPLIIKVASVPQARMQVYFIDNEEYFKRKFTTVDADGKLFADNDERMIFFCRGVLDTVKKLGWAPDIIHCNGWMSSLLPLYLKKMHKDDPMFANTKVVYSDYNNTFEGTLNTELLNKVKFDGFDDEEVAELKEPTYENLQKFALKYADGFVKTEETPEAITSFATENEIPTRDLCEKEAYKEDFPEFYKSFLEEE
ncbi:MAG: glycogen/starch synthase [Flavobacteriales bacterium]